MEDYTTFNNPSTQSSTYMENPYFSYQDQQKYSSNDEYSPSMEEQQQLLNQLSIIDNSLTFTNFIIISILLNQRVLRTQRCQLFNQTTNDACIYRLRLSSSLIIIISLFYFFNLSKDLLASNSNNTTSQSSNCINYVASGLVLTASILRLLDLVQSNGRLD